MTESLSGSVLKQVIIAIRNAVEMNRRYEFVWSVDP